SLRSSARADRRLGLMGALSDCLPDTRHPRRSVTDSTNCSASGRERRGATGDDPIHKLLLGRDAIRGEALASQPTLSRFENGVTRGELLRMSEAPFETVLRRQGQRLRRKVHTMTIDLDVTDDPTHGQQEL